MPTQYPPPSYTSKSLYPEEPSSPAAYSYQYEVEDGEYKAWEERSGYSTKGSYSVLLPDGRTMTVTYTVPDGDTGFMADVSYEGEAQYPPTQHKPEYPAPTAYQSQPSYPSYSTPQPQYG